MTTCSCKYRIFFENNKKIINSRTCCTTIVARGCVQTAVSIGFGVTFIDPVLYIIFWLLSNFSFFDSAKKSTRRSGNGGDNRNIPAEGLISDDAC